MRGVPALWLVTLSLLLPPSAPTARASSLFSNVPGLSLLSFAQLFPLPEHFSSRYPHVSLTSLHPLGLCSSITFSERPSAWQNYPLPLATVTSCPLTLRYFSLFALSAAFTPISLHKNGGYTRALYFLHCCFPRQDTLTGAAQADRPTVSLWLCTPQAAQWRCFGGERAGSKLSALSLADSKV